MRSLSASRKRVLSVAIVFLLLLSVTAPAVMAATPPPLNLPPGTVTAAYSAYLAGTNAAFDVTFSGIVGSFDVANGVVYPGWCLEDAHPANSDTVTLYSTYATNLPTNLAEYTATTPPIPIVVPPGSPNVGDKIPWDKLNYLLNNKPGAGGGQDAVQNTQAAIKLLIYGVSTDPAVTTAAQDAVDAANANGDGFVPAPGQIIGVLLYADGITGDNNDIQEVVIELTVPLYYDRGDLPSQTPGVTQNYPTYIADSGPSHLVGPDLYLGQCVDAEADGQPNAAALGDDNPPAGAPSYGPCPSTDDEDGVVRTPNVSWQQGGGGGSIDVTVAGGPGCLSGWIDWNGDGDLTTGGDNILDNVLLAPGTSTQTFTVPVNPGSGTFYARFRLYPTDNGACSTARTPTGTVTGGEVEDYQWSFTPTAVNLSGLQAARVSAGDQLLAMLRSWLRR